MEVVSFTIYLSRLTQYSIQVTLVGHTLLQKEYGALLDVANIDQGYAQCAYTRSYIRKWGKGLPKYDPQSETTINSCL
jgi:hypothetical protein